MNGFIQSKTKLLLLLMQTKILSRPA